MIEKIKKPSWFLFLTEGIRAAIEFCRCLFHLLSYHYSNIGDDRPILVVPGLTTSDLSMAFLRRFLRKHGFTNIYPWGLGRNLGDLEDINRLSKKLDVMYEKHQQKITLIGWSLGGVYVRELAKQKPELVSQIITMGSPFAAPDAPNNAMWVFKLFNDMTKIDPIWWAQIPSPAPVPTTAIYTKKDGIVPWQACLERTEDTNHKNWEVQGSHFGLPTNFDVYTILIGRF